MNKQKVLRHLNRKGLGLEIGPCHNPVAPKKDGYRVEIIDHLSREQLLNKYKEHPINFDNIEEVDFIWHGESYAELTGRKKHYDWIIASHLIEHTPDLIGFLKNCDEVLKDDGMISLVIPDKRYCFDHFRPITGLAKIIDSHFQQHQIHTPGGAAEYFLNVAARNEALAWSSTIGGDFRLIHTLEEARQGIDLVVNQQAYLDIHAWCFVPHSFRLIIQDLYNLGLTPFQEVDFFPTEGPEFYITLSRAGQGIASPRLEMLEIIESEIVEGIFAPNPAPPFKQAAEPAVTSEDQSPHLLRRLASRLEPLFGRIGKTDGTSTPGLLGKSVQAIAEGGIPGFLSKTQEYIRWRRNR